MRFSEKYSWVKPLLTLSLLLIILRVIYTWEASYLNLIWNLFLAILPLYFSYKALTTSARYQQYSFVLLWLLFFPNAAYIVTDLFHLADKVDVPMWYDVLLLFSTALTGLLLGTLSLYNIEKWLRGFMHRRYLPFIRFALQFLCGYGIYLGRYGRWNSWDVITNPANLFSSIEDHIVNPFYNAEVWLLSVSFAIFMQVMYRFAIGLKEKLSQRYMILETKKDI